MHGTLCVDQYLCFLFVGQSPSKGVKLADRNAFAMRAAGPGAVLQTLGEVCRG